MVGDGFCDDKYNIIGCNFDGGDCCLHGENAEEVDTSRQLCTDCVCFDPPKILPNCVYQDYVNNSICEDFANINECAFDGGM